MTSATTKPKSFVSAIYDLESISEVRSQIMDLTKKSLQFTILMSCLGIDIKARPRTDQNVELII